MIFAFTRFPDRMGSTLLVAFFCTLLAFPSGAEEISPGGSVIFRYEHTGTEGDFGVAAPVHTKEIVTALQPFLGGSYVLHEVDSGSLPVDLMIFRPTAERRSWTIVTSGMSSLPMHVPEQILNPAHYQYAELVLSVPAEWFTADDKGEIPANQLLDHNKFWPLNLLKWLARFPHVQQTWLAEGHSMPNGDPATPYADNVKFTGAVFAPVNAWPEQYRSIRTEKGETISLLAVLPVYDDEMAVKLDKGFDTLFETMENAGITDVLDITRPGIAAKVQ